MATSLSVLRKICLTNPERGGYAYAQAHSGVLFNWRFNHGIGARVSKRFATHMESLPVAGTPSDDATNSYVYYSVGEAPDARKCLHYLIAENFAYNTPLVFHDVVPTVDRTPYRFYLDLETADVALLSKSDLLTPHAISSHVISTLTQKVLRTDASSVVDFKLADVIAFDASKPGSKFSMHLIFPNLIQERRDQARIQTELLAALAVQVGASKGRERDMAQLLSQLIDRASHSSQPKLRMPFCDKISGVSNGGETLRAHRTLEYVGEFDGNTGAYKDFSSDVIETVIDLNKSLVGMATSRRTKRSVYDDAASSDDGGSDSSGSEQDGDSKETVLEEMRRLVKVVLPYTFWLIPSRLLPKQARAARICLTQNVASVPAHFDAEKLVEILDRACLVPESACDNGAGCGGADWTFMGVVGAQQTVGREELYASYDRMLSKKA